MKAELVCWHCGAAKSVEIPQAPQFAFELVRFAQDAGLKGYVDMIYGRALIFCSSEHARAEMTKKGNFRYRAKGPKRLATKEPS